MPQEVLVYRQRGKSIAGDAGPQADPPHVLDMRYRKQHRTCSSWYVFQGVGREWHRASLSLPSIFKAHEAEVLLSALCDASRSWLAIVIVPKSRGEESFTTTR